jgi:2-polyprenyl-3-methyl-5-hydroxy-6-metoxy-1,4-benzoquinol methylase
MHRHVEPEWLDELAPDDLLAIRSRQDLQRIHQWMGNVRIMARLLRPLAGRVETLKIADLGAGDGAFLLRVARRLTNELKSVRLTLVDRQPIVSLKTHRAFGESGWDSRAVASDVFGWLANAPSMDVVTATLFLHHFADAQLAALLDAISQRTDHFIACEPRRSALSLLASKLVGLIGCNAVSRHDAVVSVRAGFKNGELSSLWPKDGRWHLEEQGAGWFSHTFVARKADGVISEAVANVQRRL